MAEVLRRLVSADAQAVVSRGAGSWLSSSLPPGLDGAWVAKDVVERAEASGAIPHAAAPIVTVRDGVGERWRDKATAVLHKAQASIADVREERMRQAQLAFRWGLALTGFAVVIVLGCVAFAIVGRHDAAVATGGVGVVLQGSGLWLFKITKDANNRLDAIAKDLATIERVRSAFDLIGYIRDPKDRDDAVRGLVERLAGPAVSR